MMMTIEREGVTRENIIHQTRKNPNAVQDIEVLKNRESIVTALMMVRHLTQNLRLNLVSAY